jgi:hypothetical protein
MSATLLGFQAIWHPPQYGMPGNASSTSPAGALELKFRKVLHDFCRSVTMLS